MDDRTGKEIASVLHRLIEDTVPELVPRPMYGGTIFERTAGVPSSAVFGVFQRKDHVSLEFSLGAAIKDPAAFLEGTGRHRRHLKLRSMEDLESKSVPEFLKAAARLDLKTPTRQAR
jgi:hypothetical protein